MRSNSATQYLIAALEQLSLAQAAADQAAACSYAADIPNGRATRYARAFAFAHDISNIRATVRQLAGETPSSRNLESRHGALSARNA